MRWSRGERGAERRCIGMWKFTCWESFFSPSLSAQMEQIRCSASPLLPRWGAHFASFWLADERDWQTPVAVKPSSCFCCSRHRQRKRKIGKRKKSPPAWNDLGMGSPRLSGPFGYLSTCFTWRRGGDKVSWPASHRPIGLLTWVEKKRRKERAKGGKNEAQFDWKWAIADNVRYSEWDWRQRREKQRWRLFCCATADSKRPTAVRPRDSSTAKPPSSLPKYLWITISVDTHPLFYLP